VRVPVGAGAVAGVDASAGAAVPAQCTTRSCSQRRCQRGPPASASASEMPVRVPRASASAGASISADASDVAIGASRAARQTSGASCTTETVPARLSPGSGQASGSGLRPGPGSGSGSGEVKGERRKAEDARTDCPRPSIAMDETLAAYTDAWSKQE
jgi:hypothetical protein